MEYPEIKKLLEQMAESEFKNFTSKLLPGIPNILGVRLPKLRKLAKLIALEGDCVFEENTAETSYEEIMLHGMIIGYWEGSLEEKICRITNFVPQIDNWSVCDSFCSGLKLAVEYPEQMWAFTRDYCYESKEFAVRFGIVMIIFYFIDERHLEDVLFILNQIQLDKYYVKMAVAWAISICYIRFPVQTMKYLNNNALDRFTYNKALQKITESSCVDKDTKNIIREMKRKKKEYKPV